MAAAYTRRRRRRGRFGILYVLLSAVLIVGAVVGGCIVFFRVEKVTVSGSTIYSHEQIVAASGIESGDNLFLIRKIPTARKILQELPYIKEVQPRRDLPSTFHIDVTECTPAAVIKSGDGAWWILDESCKLLEQGGEELSDRYACVDGIEPLMPSVGSNLAVSVEESGKLNGLRQILSALKERDMIQNLGDVDLSGTAEITMGYEQRFTVRLPMYSDDFRHLVHTLQKIAAYLDDGQTGTIDLTGSRGRFIPD